MAFMAPSSSVGTSGMGTRALGPSLMDLGVGTRAPSPGSGVLGSVSMDPHSGTGDVATQESALGFRAQMKIFQSKC